MSGAIPVGQVESERLEFKSARALERPESVAREVVAMLNASGGEVWIGLREEDGMAVELEGIAAAEDARRRLQDSLVDLIEPSPRNEEVRIEVRGEERSALRIAVLPVAERRPYAVLQRGGARLFVVRFGDRIRPATRQELFATRRPPAGSESPERRLREAQERAQEGGEGRLWLGVEARGAEARLVLDRLAAGDLLYEPSSTGNRRLGRTFYYAAHVAGQENRQYLQRRGTPEGHPSLVARGGEFELSLDARGSVRALAPLSAFAPLRAWFRDHPRLSDLEERELLDPRALAEFPASVIRLLGTLARDPRLWSPPPDGYVAGLSLFGVAGRVLLPDPNHPYLTYPRDPRKLRVPPPEASWVPRSPEVDTVSVGPVRLTLAALREEPDYCAYRLLRSIFGEFGYSEEEILSFDRKTRRFQFG